ncbi:hypothetical protein [Gorillibacterium sp. CAU 1737]|uniref:hypothetical protein n=1 Tax=Gorillibacterium sp. CAU 1737 TaxID=3140362 RepID=UPI0032607411
MPNEKGWYTKEEVLATGLPYYIPASKRWTAMPYDYAVLMTKSRCKQLGMPILSSGNEDPCAFRYASGASMGSDTKAYRYIPLYDRTDVFEAGELDVNILYPGELMGVFPKGEDNA